MSARGPRRTTVEAGIGEGDDERTEVSGWRIEMLGGLRVRHGADSITHFRTRKAAALLALLALEPGRSYTRDHLADLLWPDEEIETTRRRLRQAISLLRSDLGPLGEAPIVTEGRDTLRLADGVETDLAAYDAFLVRGEIERAMALYIGPLLPEFYEDPIVEARERLAERHATLTNRRAERKRRPRVPLPLTPLFGRTAEIEKVAGLLAGREARLVTLLGPGGIGKTRLALDIARAAAEAFAGAVWFVPLAPVSSTEGVALAALDALREPGEETEGSSQPPLERLVDRLSELPTALLVFDNCEHLVGAATPLKALLEQVAGLSILATSRQTLGISGERRVELAPLSLDAGRAWFAHQAQAARADFRLTALDTTVIEEIVQRLDGLPLALELAAAWSSALTPTEIARRLTPTHDLLVRRDSSGDPRHTALNATIDASFSALPPDLRPFWLALSVFRGGWQREAAEAVCPTVALGTLAALAALRDRSLVTATETPDGFRWNLLAPLREFAEATLTPEEHAAVSLRHTNHYLTYANHTALVYHKTNIPGAFERLERDEANILVAIQQGLGSTPETVLHALDTLRNLAWHWWVRGRNHHSDYFLPALAKLETRLDEFSGNQRASVLRAIAFVARHRDNPTQAEKHYAAALEIYQATENLRGSAELSEQMVSLLSSQQRYTEAFQLTDEILQRYEARADEQEVAYWLSHKATRCGELGNTAEQVALLQRARALNRAGGRLGWAAKNAIALAEPLCASNSAPQAEDDLREAVAHFAETGETWNHADALRTLGEVLMCLGRTDEARSTFEEALALWERNRFFVDAGRVRQRLATLG